jgi:hypothetical protein
MKDNELADPISDAEAPEDPEANLLARIHKLESESQDALQQAERRVINSELKVEAIQAGMIDLDGLTFLDMTQVHLDENGSVSGGAELIGQLKRSKPWLFVAPSSSSTAKVPPSRPSRQKLATEMTDGEYRIARANILKRSAM